jgi:soluble lytic murein transglycosylase-like protein
MYIFEMMGTIAPTDFNDRGNDVIMLQSLLVQLGFDIGKFGEDRDGIDGWYGKRTREGVANFQQTQGITPANGIANKETIDALVNYANENSQDSLKIAKNRAKRRQDRVASASTAELIDNNELRMYITRYSKKYDLNPKLVKAIIQKESNYEPFAVGDNGTAFGLMQVRWPAFRDIKTHQSIPFSFDDMISDPEKQIWAGTAYLATVRDVYGAENEKDMARMYNGGPKMGYSRQGKNNTQMYALDVLRKMQTMTV